MTDIAQICKLNNMTEAEYFNQISLNFLALMDMQLDKHDNEPLKITKGNVSLLIMRPKEQE
tara:strand:+ start:470 stop:652 length:183 start_codon:yes stop_codon:yes gene_type:complete